MLVRSRVSGACTEDKVKEKYRVEVRKEEMGEKRWNQLCPQGLEAEYMVLQNGNDDQVVQKAFDKAISAPARAGFLQDAAPANERAGSFFCFASAYLTRAHELYLEWGATVKAAHLEGNHTAVDFQCADCQFHSTSIKCPSRFSR